MLLEIKELEEIMQQHTERLIRLAFYYVKDLQSAEDIVQDVFIKFYDNQQNYEERGELRAYLSRLVINKSKDYLRSWTYRKIQVQQKIFAKKAIMKRDMLVQQDEQTLIENAILALPLKQREVLIYFYFEEMPVIEIAELLSIPESTVKTRLRRGRELLKPKLQHIEWEVLLHE
ncbi:sigma-70 family RNA polymerase sigma factor [Lysinibacillus sp. fls2-241-R2A-57]|uniref:sigma-70 family RNA polymerase sigma factor n=1 Tax=Lysinibacillus sp. fls2-241-R2A-57 TaxID=3040292 RepID=UPI002553DECD|nr:sigma-70 family RNA polymerase sigma factor [Lysinibacillus sp. fls2-241-R2A-57]